MSSVRPNLEVGAGGRPRDGVTRSDEARTRVATITWSLIMKTQYLMAAAAAILATTAARAECTNTAGKTYTEEWVYEVRWGHQHEWWKLFQKYQIPTLDRERKLGLVKSYVVQVPELHASNASRWDFRVIVTYRDYEASQHGDDIERRLFPDREKRKRDDLRRWDLTINHWDMPIADVDPNCYR
jgi:hypothetical protein